MRKATVFFRFYEELNDFLPLERKKSEFSHHVRIPVSIKDVIESLGVPHSEIDLILVNGVSVDFSYLVQPGDRISVYPVFESIDISSVTHLRPRPLRQTRFVLDVHLGKLARYLRLLGFDTRYDTQYDDAAIIELALRENRIILTRDVGLLKNKTVTHGYWVRETRPENQVMEVLRRFDLRPSCQPFTRCLECNGSIVPAELSQEEVNMTVPARVREMQDHYFRCDQCKRVYWQGTHYEKLKKFIAKMLDLNF
ncbi:hypothetical protein AQUSIP_01100 [Aquicella siphonis]|uniref:Twitching motility protein PilT n=1 Tax=Aquicella siphonis TaxID=254247 RepID=A0A5E4PEE1_9COXI|nr:Mut7-C RNAse domain-containing protein [Aquicella siphonis]VVC74838.1 hypothetical protein AQUSIP_01100 [Aquicella siphonis]